MFNTLQALAMGIIGFAIIIGIGTVILGRFGGAVATCGDLLHKYCLPLYGNDTEYNLTTDTCGFLEDGSAQNGTFIDYTPATNQTQYNYTQDSCGHLQDGVTQNGTFESAGGNAYGDIGYLNTQLGQSGLAGWTPAIIALSVGMLFLGAFMFKRAGQDRAY